MVKVDKLKKKLELLKLSTAGTKVELLQRMRAAMEEETRKCEDQPEHGSESGSARSSESIESSSGFSENSDMSQMLETIQKIMLENSVQLHDMENKFHKYTQRQENLLAEQQKIFEDKFKKQQEITDSFHDKVQKLQKHVEVMQERIKNLEENQTNTSDKNDEQTYNGERMNQNQENNVDELQEYYPSKDVGSVRESKTFKKHHFDENMYEKIHEKKIHELQLGESRAQCKNFLPPTFDGTSSFSLFRLQFETAINANQWNDEDRLAALVLTLRAGALAILQTLPRSEKNSYEALMNALQQKYDSKHMKQFYRLSLQNCIQSCSETLQEHAVKVERLVHMGHGLETTKDLEQYKIEAFINGILDPGTKYAALINPKLTYTETIAHALTHEAAATSAGHLNRLNADKDNLTKALCEAVKTAIRAGLEADCLNHKSKP